MTTNENDKPSAFEWELIRRWRRLLRYGNRRPAVLVIVRNPGGTSSIYEGGAAGTAAPPKAADS